MDYSQGANQKAMSSKGMMERLEDISNALDIIEKQEAPPKRTFMDKLTGKNKINKEYKLPLKVKFNSKGKLKKNYAIVEWVSTNGYSRIDFAPIEDDFVYNKHAGTWHKATSEYIIWYNKYPKLIIPEFNNTPINFKKYSEKIEAEGSSARNQKTLIEIGRKAELAGKKKFSMNIMWIIIGGIIALYLIASILGVSFT